MVIQESDLRVQKMSDTKYIAMQRIKNLFALAKQTLHDDP